MRNTDPPDSNGHRSRSKPSPTGLKITPELHRFIQRMGGYFESSGIPPIGGRILGLLMIAHEPLSAENIASILHVSRASLSTNFRVLAAAGLAERYASHTDRTTYYSFPDTAWEQAMALGLQRAQQFQRIIEEGLAAMDEKDSARWHLLRGIEYAELITQFYQKQVDEWRMHHKKQSRPASVR